MYHSKSGKSLAYPHSLERVNPEMILLWSITAALNSDLDIAQLILNHKDEENFLDDLDEDEKAYVLNEWTDLSKHAKLDLIDIKARMNDILSKE